MESRIAMTEMDGLAPDELRALVREALRDALPGLAARNAAADGPVSDSTPSDSTIPASTIPDSSVSGSSISDYPRPESTAPESTVPEGTPRPGGSVQEVRLSTNAELRAFVLQILRLADNPKRRSDILAGRLRFVLADAGGPAAPAVTHRVDKGAVTERAVIGAARAGARLVLGPRAVLTPLARDKARALRVPVEKER